LISAFKAAASPFSLILFCSAIRCIMLFILFFLVNFKRHDP
jgi:hypothetical protein